MSKCRFCKEIAKSNSGLSLVEILISLTILVSAGAFITGKVMDKFHEGRVMSATIQMQGLTDRLLEFKRKCNFFPSTEQGLDALVTKPTSGRDCKRYPPNGFIESKTGDEIPLDPWDNEYVYTFENGKYNIVSYGSDGEEGGEDTDKDIPLRKNK